MLSRQRNPKTVKSDKKETAKAEQEAKMDAKFNEAKGGEENNNILVLKIKESIKKVTFGKTETLCFK